MRLILIGCEYSGGSTMSRAISGWLLRERAATAVRIHDHWVYPYIADQDPSTCFIMGPDGIVPEEWRYSHLGNNDSAALSEEWASDVRALKPWLLEQLQRIMVWRHMHHTVIEEDASDSIQVGLHYAEAVYAPLYYGYGRDSFSDRRRRARQWDRALLEFAPETILVLLRASPEAIRERMRAAAPRPDGVPREEDIEKVIDLFEEQYANTELNQKLAIRTSGVTVEESVAEFADRVEPFLTDEDRRRKG